MKREILCLGLLFAVVACSSPQGHPWSGTDTWSFNPGTDDFRADALLDLRSLNEKVAGESGWVEVDSNGDFLLGNGKPVRFWCVGTSVGREKPFIAKPLGRKTEPSLARHARFLAKRGVNMVRLHSQLSPRLDRPITDVAEGERDWIWRTVAAMKKEGIYTTVSPYWMVPMKFADKWGIPGGPNQSAAGLLFFDPTLQGAYKSWLRALLAEKNPYTGVPLAKDPALAILEIQNEDSLLFWTVDNIKGEQRRNLGRKFGEWLAKKHGSLKAATRRWQGDRAAGDDIQGGVVDFLPIWEMTQQRSGGRQARLSDQLHFWSETMFAFDKEVERFVREDLGCKVLINAGNWRTADSLRLFDAERWSYTANEVDAVNRYLNGYHKGPYEGWAIAKGDRFSSPSILTDPSSFPLTLKQTLGRPMIVTESTWVMPMGYSSEAPFLVAAYQGLTGIDGYYWFATDDDEWTQPQSGNGYNESQQMWLFGNPDMLGTFPGAALMYRLGYVKRGAPSVVEHRSLADLWERKAPIIAEEAGFDPNRDTGDISSRSSVRSFVDPKAFLVGPVEVAFDDQPEKTKALNLAPYAQGGTIRSDSGELALNVDKAYCELNAPCAQGVTAFFGRQSEHRLADVSLRSGNEYGAALVVSMDRKPIRSSSKVLVQFGTRCRPTGWAEKPSTIDLGNGKTLQGLEVVSIGTSPWQVAKADLTVTISNRYLTKANVLDMNGNSAGVVKLERLPSGVRFVFPPTAMYVVLR